MQRSRIKILCLLLWCCSPIVGDTTTPDVIVLMEQQVRSRARMEVLPKYPGAALKEKAQGVVVAMVEFDEKGVVRKVGIVEAANQLFAAPTIKALKQWRFDPIVPPNGEVLYGRGKITFYFYYENGVGRTEHPQIFKQGKNERKS